MIDVKIDAKVLLPSLSEPHIQKKRSHKGKMLLPSWKTLISTEDLTMYDFCIRDVFGKKDFIKPETKNPDVLKPLDSNTTKTNLPIIFEWVYKKNFKRSPSKTLRYSSCQSKKSI